MLLEDVEMPSRAPAPKKKPEPTPVSRDRRVLPRTRNPRCCIVLSRAGCLRSLHPPMRPPMRPPLRPCRRWTRGTTTRRSDRWPPRRCRVLFTCASGARPYLNSEPFLEKYIYTHSDRSHYYGGHTLRFSNGSYEKYFLKFAGHSPFMGDNDSRGSN